MTNSRLIKRLKTLKKSVLEDGKVDWNETEQLLEAIRPLTETREFIFENYKRLLEKCREDGKITSEESRQLALQLEFLCTQLTNRRLKTWLLVAVIALLAVISLSLIRDIASATDTRSLAPSADAVTPEQAPYAE